MDGGAVMGINTAEQADAPEGAESVELQATTMFVPLLSEGTVDVVFTFDASELAEKTVVAFESLARDDIAVVTHADITDEEQSIHFFQGAPRYTFAAHNETFKGKTAKTQVIWALSEKEICAILDTR